MTCSAALTRILAACLLGVTAWSTTAQAQADCGNYTREEVTACEKADLKTADDALNAAWKETKHYYDTLADGTALLDAQRKWLAFRDAECAAEASIYPPGPSRESWVRVCLIDLTQDRTAQLRSLLRE